jgi:hypothetical protein
MVAPLRSAGVEPNHAVHSRRLSLKRSAGKFGAAQTGHDVIDAAQMDAFLRIGWGFSANDISSARRWAMNPNAQRTWNNRSGILS